MSSFFSISIVLISAIIIGYIVLRFFFKGSILFLIGGLWLSNIFLTFLNSRISIMYPDEYPFGLALIAGLGMPAIFLWYVYRSVRKPLDDLTEKIKILSQGDLRLSADKKNIKYRGELIEMSVQVNNLRTNLMSAIVSISQSADKVSHMGDTMNLMAEDLASSTNEQASSIEEISSSMEEMKATIDGTNQNAHQTKLKASEAKENIALARSQSAETFSNIQLIREKVNIVNEIADRTNLLALNASIEAKSVGAAGSGFVVVASEVQRLAEITKNAAVSIIELAEKGLFLSETVSLQLNTTLPHMVETVSLMEELSASSNEQASGADQIMTATSEINQNIQSNATISERLSTHSNHLADESINLVKSITFFKR